MPPINPFLYGNPGAFGQQTAVGRALIARSSGSMGGKRSARKRRSKAKAAPVGRRRKAKKLRLVKGSRAAKAYMAKIRRKRKK